MGTILSQQARKDNKIHPWAFFSRCLAPAQCNYSIRDHELLPVKLALEQEHHWLEGSEQPFVVLRDRKNLEYLCSAKRLNSCQARWVLFFNCTLSYRPGTTNCKADTLSCQYEPQEEEESPNFILPPYAWLAAARLDIKRQVVTSLENGPVPFTCPNNRLFFPGIQYFCRLLGQSSAEPCPYCNLLSADNLSIHFICTLFPFLGLFFKQDR